MVDSTNLPKVDINAIATDLNNKMDRDGVNASCPVVISRTANSYGGVVEIWSDGYCVQTGITETVNIGTAITVTFPQPYKDTTYNVGYEATLVSTDDPYFKSECGSFTTSSFVIKNRRYSGSGIDTLYYRWRTEGYIR